MKVRCSLKSTVQLAFVFLTLFYWCNISSPLSETIDNEKAKKVSENFVNSYFKSRSGSDINYTISSINELHNDNGICIAYFVKLNPMGYVIISGYESIRPIICYSLNSDISYCKFIDSDLFQIIKMDIEKILHEIHNNSECQHLVEQNHSLWVKYSQPVLHKPISDLKIWGPLISTNWDQRSSITPFIDDHRTVLGCVPLAVAQIINYWKYPKTLNFTEDDSYISKSIIDGFEELRIDVNIPNDYENYNFPSFSELNKILEHIDGKL